MAVATRAIIRWVPEEQGGRRSVPTGPQYSAVVRFEDQRDKWPQEAWDLVLDFVRSFGREPRAMLAKVRFLSEEAPVEMLQAGARFELCEGRRVVAKGVVLPQSIRVPSRLNEFALALLG